MNRDLFDLPPEPEAGHTRRPSRTRQIPLDPHDALPSPAGAAAERPYTVAAVNALAREIIESSFPPLWVQGEVTGWNRHRSGHCYFGLRDRSAQLRAVMFRLDAMRLPTDPENGMQVRVLGTVTLYEKKGDFQLVVRELEGLDAGGLWRIALEKLRAKLAAEGLLDPERKRPLPRFPATVGVVTSPVGAAIHDIKTVIAKRAPWTRILVAPARVQGDGAADDLTRAVRALGRTGRVDVIIVGRGGGSTDDLWAFNDERLARGIAASPVPVVSAVGHETDITIADLVADVRAPTPSAAAELVVPDGAVIAASLRDSGVRMRTALRRTLTSKIREVDSANMLLRESIERFLDARRERGRQLALRLDALSPLAALARGFAVPTDEEGHVLRSVGAFGEGTAFRLRVVDGTVACRSEGASVDEGVGRV